MAGPSTGAFTVEGGRVVAVWSGVALDNHSDVLSNGSDFDCQKKKQRFRL